jgi:hypothetical protein
MELLTSKLFGASTELPSRIIQKKVWESHGGSE